VGADSRSSCKSDGPDLLTPRKTRVLPAWMKAAAPAALNTSPVKGIGRRTSCLPQRQLGSLSGLFVSAYRLETLAASVKRAPARTARNTHTGPKRPRARLPSSSGDEEEEKGVDEDKEEGCSNAARKRARKLQSDTEESQDQAEAPVSKSSPEISQVDEDTNADKAAQTTDEQEKDEESKKTDGGQTSKAGGSTSRPESSRNSQTNVQQKVKVQHRTPCPYGTSCY
ncbi:aprataxin and PNK-like factor, partial [Tachysurus ichikawai]